MAGKKDYGTSKKGGKQAGFRNAKLARQFGAKGSGGKKAAGKGNAWTSYLGK